MSKKVAKWFAPLIASNKFNDEITTETTKLTEAVQSSNKLSMEEVLLQNSFAYVCLFYICPFWTYIF